MLNIVDTKTASKVLVSSRISGLVKNSTEVKLALMTTEESVNMLAHASGLDAQEIPAELVEVAGLCGRLPLCLNIAAQIIGGQWQTLPCSCKCASQYTVCRLRCRLDGGTAAEYARGDLPIHGRCSRQCELDCAGFYHRGIADFHHRQGLAEDKRCVPRFR